MLKELFINLKNSFYNPSFYSSLSSASIGKGIGFIAFWSFIGAVVAVIVIIVQVAPEMSRFSPVTYVESHYPDELVITIEDGVATTNVEEPYVIILEEGDSEDVASSSIAVLDTKRDLTLSDISAHDALVVLTKDTVIFKKSEGETRMFPLSEMEDFEIDKDLALELAEKSIYWFKVLIVPIALLTASFIAAMSVLYYLVCGLVGALLVMLVGRFCKKQFEFGTAYAIALFAFGPVMVADMIYMLFGDIAFPSTAVLIIFTVVVIANIRKMVGPESGEAEDVPKL